MRTMRATTATMTKRGQRTRTRKVKYGTASQTANLMAKKAVVSPIE